jgi:hypothetical protein
MILILFKKFILGILNSFYIFFFFKINIYRFEQIKAMGINIYGIHFHCGSGQHGSKSFKTAIDIANMCMEIGKTYGH